MRKRIALVVVFVAVLAFTSCRNRELCPAYTNAGPVVETQAVPHV